MSINKFIFLIIFILCFFLLFQHNVHAIEYSPDCIKPISDSELFKKYKPCEGGWCLRK